MLFSRNHFIEGYITFQLGEGGGCFSDGGASFLSGDGGWGGVDIGFDGGF